ncbi:MAG: SAM-dependent methyltransferase [Rhodospirillales bacterium]|nr:SAM-dependent methyltransferase [Rhodospirillales bacterium]
MGLANAAYYAQGAAIGREGDFITAPEISQVFGELIGAWLFAQWQVLGAPDPVRVVELGPGRGALIADLLRVAALRPAFAKAIDLHLVETSKALRARQKQALGGRPARWHDSFDEVPEGPLLLVANEFLDALPVRQWVRREDGWRERLVGVADGRLAFQESPDPDPGAPAILASAHQAAPLGVIVEHCPTAHALIAKIAQRIARAGGYALFIDYGPAASAPGDSLQAVRRHRPAPILERPGRADLTAHVDFQALAETAGLAGVAVFGPLGQGVWLERLGIVLRTQALIARAPPDTAHALARATQRLIAPTEMGTLFKTMALAPKTSPPPPGYEVS